MVVASVEATIDGTASGMENLRALLERPRSEDAPQDARKESETGAKNLAVKLLMTGGTQRFPFFAVNRYDSVFKSGTATNHELNGTLSSREKETFRSEIQTVHLHSSRSACRSSTHLSTA
jgi:hypothetical protein